MRGVTRRRGSGTLTAAEVDVLGDLVPRAVVEVAHLLLVLHHAGRLALLLVLERDVVLDGLEVLAVLRETKKDPSAAALEASAAESSYPNSREARTERP